MKLVIYGLTITSAWGNGHATTYRSLARALAHRHHSVRFIEKDVEWYCSNRDLADPDFYTVRLLRSWQEEEQSLLEEARDADAVIVGSYFPDAIVATRTLLDAGCGPIFFYDIDTPITMSQLRGNGRCEYLESALIPHYAAYLSFTGGPALAELEQQYGAQRAIALYCSVDADSYTPVPPRDDYACDLSYLGTYAPDRQPALMALLNQPAERMPDGKFLVAGAMYPPEIAWGRNVRRMTHVAPPDHPAFFSSSRFTLNLTRQDMAAAGWSPSVRLFEASACGAAILSDAWEGLSDFLTPGEEVLLPNGPADVVTILRDLPDAERIRMGRRARERILAQHTSLHRAQELEAIISACSSHPVRAAEIDRQRSEVPSLVAPR